MKVKNAQELLDIALNNAWERDDRDLGWLLSQLAGVSDVEFSDEIETACIKKSGNRYMIRFSKSFVEKYLATPDDILFVLLHEIMHKVRGDLLRDMKLRGPVDHQVANIAEDMLINAELCARFFPEPPALFGAIYDCERFPDIMLTPPPVLLKDATDSENGMPLKSMIEVLGNWDEIGKMGWNSNEIMHGLHLYISDYFENLRDLPEPQETNGPSCGYGPDREALSDTYGLTWFLFFQMDVASIYNHIRPFFPQELQILLIGNHEDKDCDIPGWDEAFGQNGGHSDKTQDEEIDLDVPYQYVSKVARLLKQAIDADPMNPLEAMLYQPDKSVIPWVGRRESLWLSNGIWPVFFNTPTFSKDLDHVRPHIYIDVSASTKEYQPMIYGLVHHLFDIIGEPIYLFSNKVAEASLEDICKGRMKTTGGTDFDCVIEHAAKNRFQKIVVITDGFADMNASNRRKVTEGEMELHLVLTGDGYYDEELQTLAKSMLILS